MRLIRNGQVDVDGRSVASIDSLKISQDQPKSGIRNEAFILLNCFLIRLFMTMSVTASLDSDVRSFSLACRLYRASHVKFRFAIHRLGNIIKVPVLTVR